MKREEFTQKFKVGDKIRFYNWGIDIWVEIKYIGKTTFFVENQDGRECYYNYDTDDLWLRYKGPKPKVVDPRIGMTKFIIHSHKTDYRPEWIIEKYYKSKEDAIENWGEGLKIYQESDFE